jgi:UPF0755 protein
MKKLLALAGVLVALALAAVAGGYLYAEGQIAAAVAPDDDTEIIFVVPKGSSARALGAKLAEAGLIADTNMWRYFLYKRKKLDAKAGRHPLKKSMTMAEIGDALEKAPMPEDVPFTFVEGWRLRDSDAALAAKGWIKPGEYIAMAKKPGEFSAPFALPKDTLEGYLYPETYGVVPDRFDLKGLIQRQLDGFTRRFYDAHKDDIAKSGRTLHDLVKMASMLEREEPVPKQRPLVAGILWKRIDRNFPLGVDATSRYELAQWNDRKAFLKKLRDEDDAYNTRHKTGLPPTPIGAATLSSLQAAMQPKKSPYLYYLHDAQKVLHPSRNAEEHEALRKKYNVY